jgi:opacity protein-like surface antigen
MRKSVFIFTFLLFSISSWAQSSRDTSHGSSFGGDIFLGYSLQNGDTLHSASGLEAALTGNIRDWFGLKADFSSHYKSESGAGARTYNMLFGPQVAHKVGKIRIYGHGLAGVAHFSGFGFTSQNSLGWALGGGADYNFTDHLAFRPVQLDYLGSHLFSTTQSNVRYSVGLVYRF